MVATSRVANRYFWGRSFVKKEPVLKLSQGMLDEKITSWSAKSGLLF
jgi:hypothetical protein